MTSRNTALVALLGLQLPGLVLVLSPTGAVGLPTEPDSQPEAVSQKHSASAAFVLLTLCTLPLAHHSSSSLCGNWLGERDWRAGSVAHSSLGHLQSMHCRSNRVFLRLPQPLPRSPHPNPSLAAGLAARAVQLRGLQLGRMV